MPSAAPLLALLGCLSLGVAAAYSVLSVIAVSVWQLRKGENRADPAHPTTLLKPLCGAEPGLYRQLRSFCRQDHPSFQIVFGLRDSTDPAHAVVSRLIEEFPALGIRVVVDPRLHGGNCKISNLMNMLPHADHDVLVMADSDAEVRPDYLRTVTAPLSDPHVGLVTCIYRGVPTRTLWSRLGAMYINEWYMPSVLLASMFGHQGYVSGQTVCIRRPVLRSVGGLDVLANHLADDYRLGELVRAHGLRVVLSRYEVTAEHHEPSLSSVTHHELRWMRTLRVLRPKSFRLLCLSFTMPLATIGFVLATAEGPARLAVHALFGIAVVARGCIHLLHRRGAERPLFSDVWLIPLRDVLLCYIWCRSFFSLRVTWRGLEFDVDPQGLMRRLS